MLLHFHRKMPGHDAVKRWTNSGWKDLCIVAHIDLTGVLGMNACPGQHQTRPKRTSMASLLEMPHLAEQRIQHGHTWQLGSVTLPNQATSRLPTKRRKTVCRDREAQKVPQSPSALLYSPTLFFTFLQSLPQAKSLADCPFLGPPFSLRGWDVTKRNWKLFQFALLCG